MRRSLALGLGGAIVLGACRPPQPAASLSLELAPDPGNAAFARVTAPRAFELPLDHGPHHEYQTEWWYFTGNVFTAEGRHFGYQLTFFRRGLSPGPPPPSPGLSTNQVHFAHFALTDTASGGHVFSERWSRGAGGLAGAGGEPFAVFLEGWRVEASDQDGRSLRLRATDADRALDLRLESQKPLSAHGDRGLSAKSATPGNASYYVGYTRLVTSGRLVAEGRSFDVTGSSWFDHEWSTSALGPGAVGWDWFSLQLDDGHELMLFGIRRQDGSLEPVSGGTWIEPDGRTRRLAMADVALQVEAHWRSTESGARYPSRWRLEVPALELRLHIEPWLAAQEMRTSFTYWEGAVRLSGTRRDAAVTGNGYVELTGYARSMRDVF